MKYLSYITACLLSGALFIGCTNLEDTECSTCGGSQDTGVKPYSVTFQLGGSAGAVSRAADVTHTPLERALKTLYAVVFSDSDNSGDLATTDLFVAAIQVDLTNYNNPEGAQSPHLSFNLTDPGQYNICFVANPSEDPAEGEFTGLLTKITSLEAGVSTVETFENLVEEAAPGLTNFLMTSGYHNVVTALGTPAEIGTVALTRAVARIDVLNLADGLDVEKLEFYNYAVKSRLVAANTPADAFDTEYIIKKKVYEPEGGIIGNSEPEEGDESNYYHEQIYTYEQYAGTGTYAEASATYCPALKIIYNVPSLNNGISYSHTVKFDDVDGNAVPLKRNYHYLVTLTSDGGQINFDIRVKRWDVGEVFERPSSDFAENANDVQP